MLLQTQVFLIGALAASCVDSASIADVFLDMKYSTSASKAVDMYNQRSNSDFLFKLFRDEHAFKLSGSDGQRQTNFTIKETLCRKTDARMLDECEFKTDGLLKICTATTNSPETLFSVVCNGVVSGTIGDGNNDKTDHNIHGQNPKGDNKDVVVASTHFTTERTAGLLEGDGDFREEEISGLILPDVDVIILEDGSEFILENRKDRPEEKLLPQRQTLQKLKNNVPRGRFLGKMMCLDCIFRILSRK